MNPFVFPLILFGVGTAVSLVFFAIAYLRGAMTKGWVATTGLVVNRKGGTTGFPGYYPTFQWADQTGRTHQSTSMVGASLQPGPGTRVPVKYDPVRPHRGVMDTLTQSGRLFYWIGGVIVAITYLIGFAGLAIVISFQTA